MRVFGHYRLSIDWVKMSRDAKFCVSTRCFVLFVVLQFRKLLLELFHLLEEVGELAVIDHLAPFLVGFDGGHPKECLTFLRHALVYGRECVDDGSVGDMQVLVDHGFGPDDTLVAEDGAAGDGALRPEKAAFAHDGVVPDLDEVVELASVADGGGARYAAVDADEAAEFHVVADDGASARVEFQPSVRPPLEVAGVGADDTAGLDDDVVADDGVRVDAHVGVYQAVLADDDVLADECAGLDDSALADSGGGVYHLGLGVEGDVVPYGFQVGLQRVVGDQQGLACRTLGVLVDQDYRGFAAEHPVVVLLIVHKGKVALFDGVDLVDATNDIGGISFHREVDLDDVAQVADGNGGGKSHYLTLSPYLLVRVSTLMISPVSMKSGTNTSAPVSTVARLAELVAVSPFTPGSV